MLKEKEKDIYDLLYKNIDGSSLSWKARNKLSTQETEHLIYGEMSFDSLINIFLYERIKNYLNSAETFYDLGSGIGRIIFASSLILENIKNFIGIEILDDLINTSNDLKLKIKDLKLPFNKNIDFIKNDFFNVNYEKADVIFMHYPMKNAEELYLKLEEKLCSEVRKNTLIISVIRKLKDETNFPCLGKNSINADYGDTTAYYHIKV